MNAALQAIFDVGNAVGEYAKKLFPKGVEETSPYYEIDLAIKNTKKYITEGNKVIFEACAGSEDGIYSKIDILKKVRGSDKWDLIEVKSSTSVKDYHIDDMAAQRYAFEGSGYKIRKSNLMYINKHYIRSGDIDVKELFIIKDCTEEVIERMELVRSELPKLLKTLKKRKEPQVEIGSHCSNPFGCDFANHCWKHIPDYSVYNIARGKKLEQLIEMGIYDLSDIPEDFPITGLKKIDLESHKSNRININKAELKDWTSELIYPLYYLDYETIGFSNPVPLFDNTSPYQQIPFQYSLHIQKTKKSKLIHHEFLYEGLNDPREEFVKQLVADCGSSGSVVSYNASFEKSVNYKLADLFPKYKKKLLAINDRMVDLLVPFRNRSLYHPKQKSSASIKYVLPAFVPELSYSDLEISDGGSASLLYQDVIIGKLSGVEKEKVLSDLKKYCELDTYAMVELLRVIYEHIA